MDLSHTVLDIIKAEDRVGGIHLTALVNRVQAHMLARKEPAPNDMDVKTVVFDLLNSEVIRAAKDNRLRLPEQVGKAQADAENKSRTRPIGIGDTLFNAAGEAVAEVTQLGTRMETDPFNTGFQKRFIQLEVKALFKNIVLPGEQLYGSFEILGGTTTIAYDYESTTTKVQP